jgi:hypothetical protein
LSFLPAPEIHCPSGAGSGHQQDPPLSPASRSCVHGIPYSVQEGVVICGVQPARVCLHDRSSAHANKREQRSEICSMRSEHVCHCSEQRGRDQTSIPTQCRRTRLGKPSPPTAFSCGVVLLLCLVSTRDVSRSPLFPRLTNTSKAFQDHAQVDLPPGSSCFPIVLSQWINSLLCRQGTKTRAESRFGSEPVTDHDDMLR